MHMKRAIAVAFLITAPAAWADEVFLRGGGSIHGEVLQRTATAVVMEVGPGRMTLPMSRVERIVSKTSDISVYRDRAAALSAGDVAGWLALAQWAEGRDLLTQARDAFERVIAVDPQNAAANAALGHVRMAGQWVTPEESYRARGFVSFEGRWISPEERADILAERAADARTREVTAEAEARTREAEARARAAEADAQRAEADAQAASNGIPYPYVLGGIGVYGPYGSSGPYGPYGGVYGSGGHGGRSHGGRNHGTHGRTPGRGAVVSSPPPSRDEAGVAQSRRNTPSRRNR